MKLRRSWVVYLAAVGLLLSVAVTADDDGDEDEEEEDEEDLEIFKDNEKCEAFDFTSIFEELRKVYMWGYNQGNFELLGNFYLENAVLGLQNYFGKMENVKMIKKGLLEEKVMESDYIELELVEAFAFNCTMAYSWEKVRYSKVDGSYSLANAMIIWQCTGLVEDCSNVRSINNVVLNWRIMRELVGGYYKFDVNDEKNPL